MRRTPPEENLPPIHLPGWPTQQRDTGHQQPSFFDAGIGYSADPERGKVYVVPPFSFSFNFKIGPLKPNHFRQRVSRSRTCHGRKAPRSGSPTRPHGSTSRDS
jgi:hypothetical protein